MAKLLDQLKRSEKARSDTESQLKSTQKSLSDLQHAADKHASVKEKLQVISRKKYFVNFLWNFTLNQNSVKSIDDILFMHFSVRSKRFEEAVKTC